MNIDKKLLSVAAEQGAKNATKALSQLTSGEVVVDSAEVNVFPLTALVDAINGKDSNSIITYAQLLTGVSGAAFLIIERNAALSLVDLLLWKKIGETQVLNNLDQDAVKETLNILSNSYNTALAQFLGITIGVSVPYFITMKRIAEIIDYVASNNKDEIITFDTKLMIKARQVKVNMFVLFGAGLAELIGKPK